ncbi:MAG: hypothetical protein V3576_08800, partial [Candidatus Cloacimonadota bacterium]
YSLSTLSQHILTQPKQPQTRYWVKRELEDGRKDVYDVYTLSLVVWRDHFFSAIKTRLTGAVLSVVEAERDGAATDGAILITLERFTLRRAIGISQSAITSRPSARARRIASMKDC